MRKKLALITLEKNAKEMYLNNINDLFGDYIEVKAYCVYDELPECIKADLVVVSNEYVNNHIHFRLNANTEIVYLRRTFIYENLKRIFELPHGTKAMLIDYSMETCMNIISVLKGIGIRHIEWIPVHKEMKKEEIEKHVNSGIDLAVTPGLRFYSQKQVSNVIDIGWTVIDMSTMLEIATKLHIYDDEIEQKLLLYSLNTFPLNNSILATLKNNILIKNIHEEVLNVMEDGVLIINQDNKLMHWNKSLLTLLNIYEKDLENCAVSDSGLQSKLKELLLSEETLENVVFEIKEIGKNVIITKKLVNLFKDSKTYLVILKDISAVQEESAAISRRIKEQGYIAKYTFDRIVARHNTMLECINKAKTMATVDGAVLITGESGTGKEVFAQSIHNSSQRKEMPFVAINCAALPETLLESELFGYEAGAFTDAKKTGKKGLFEIAHKGTIFLDEIGDMPKALQAKLLRVLQEREVMRIGGHSIIPIDVRIIAATNQDLFGLVEEKAFREDLFYRLNVIPLHLPALRERKRDIPLLIQEVFRELKINALEIDDELMGMLMRYNWRGNVRELKNCIQYMVYMSSGKKLTAKDAPDYIRKVNIVINEGCDDKDEIEYKILKLLEERNMGRREIHRRLKEQGEDVSEYEIRKVMERLKESGCIEYKSGRSGAKIRI